ncbi:N-acetylmuramoyl-L-alanine amidase [Paenibacillus hamazuiensis]|uniref:N-acetylmuramoyl-L-alanine amidase n=1 Tax=Paenibacillus hamazuiensis TaxID=2936508 RepID=UPI00200C7089
MKKQTVLLISVLLILLAFPFQALAVSIVVDAGHGGSDPGAIGVNGLEEKAVNLDIARRLKDELTARGYDVSMTRDSDVFVSLGGRVEFTNDKQPDLFVSIHANSYSNPATRGAMVLYYDNAYPNPQYPASEEMKELTPQSKELAQDVLSSIVRSMGVTDKGLLPSSVYVVRMGQVPSILVETAFLSNRQDADMLADDGVRQQFADAIADGIEAYKPPVSDKAPNVLPDTIGHWVRDAVLRLNEKGIVEGVGNRFEPNRAMTRAEWVALMTRTLGTPAGQAAGCSSAGSASVTGAVYSCSAADKPSAAYKDLPATHWAYGIMTKAAAAGLINGYEDGTLRPDQPITRAEVAALFQRQLGSSFGPAWNGAASFKDVPADYWAAKSIYGLRAAGIIDGMSDTAFMPQRSMTRAEAAAMLDKYLNKSVPRK